VIPRTLEPHIAALAESFPAVWLMGPRQSGKTTLARKLFPRWEYISFEDLDNRAFATQDPRGFLRQHPSRVILDEAQKSPELLSYLQTHMDASGKPGQFVLTGSRQFSLASLIGQSLAGRVGLAHLYPFTLGELHKKPPLPIEKQNLLASSFIPASLTLEECLFKGFYPAVHDRKAPPSAWYGSYYATYVERDVREMTGVKDLAVFDTFVRLCAARSGAILNHSELANAAGVALPTVKSWLGILSQSGIIALVQPHGNNFSKRLIKAPKLYFLDTGLLCYLLRITDPGQIPRHPLKGALFETCIASEIMKHFWHRGLEPPIYFWRDHAGREIDLLVDLGTAQWPVEIKSAETFRPEFADTLRWWLALPGNNNKHGTVIFAGEKAQTHDDVTVRPWRAPF
jgi:predicted AAA+ superfamily ATPase